MRTPMRTLNTLRSVVVALGCVGVTSLAVTAALASEAADTMQGMHEHHHQSRQKSTSIADYIPPAVKLVRDDGKVVSLPEEMNDGRAVVLNFIFTTCGSICPLMSQTFAQFQRQLGPNRDRVHLMSISTDPEQDTPARLREYAQGFRAGPGWQHYTGTLAASIAAQQAFDVYRGDKMSHTAVTLLRASNGKHWWRIDGFVTPTELLAEYRLLQASSE